MGDVGFLPGGACRTCIGPGGGLGYGETECRYQGERGFGEGEFEPGEVVLGLRPPGAHRQMRPWGSTPLFCVRALGSIHSIQARDSLGNLYIAAMPLTLLILIPRPGTEP